MAQLCDQVILTFAPRFHPCDLGLHRCKRLTHGGRKAIQIKGEIGGRSSGSSIRQWLDHQWHEGRGRIDRHHRLPLGARPRPPERCRAISLYFAATSQTRAPGRKLSATIRALRSFGQRRRPVGPSRTLNRDTLLDPRTSIRRSFCCAKASRPQTQLQDGMPEPTSS